MRLLIDTDAFCKLAIGGVLSDALAVLGVEFGDCGRLAALPYMLQRGKLTRTYGLEACASIGPLAKDLGTIPTPDAIWLDPLTRIRDIDPGEAQLFAYGAQESLILMTGDKRALLALKTVDGYAEALAGHIVILEVILMVLCDQLGPDEVRRRLGSLMANDKTLSICFSANNPSPRVALESYFHNFANEVHPLTLWSFQTGDTV